MKVAFTLCSNNYLGQAKVLVETFKKFHTEFDFVLGLVDKRDINVDYGSFDCSIIDVAEIVAKDQIEEFSAKFNIVELNTTVKPFYFKYFFLEKNADEVIYLDPDIQIFSCLHEVMRGLSTSMITLTPHMLSPVDDEFGPNDYHILRTGIFNLGFIGLSKHRELEAFLNWWQDRCIKYGFRRDELGMFYDQIWINYVPAFFESYYIIKHPGYNMANWNLHERTLSLKDDKWYVNKKYQLAFFHFSHFNVERPGILSPYNSRFSFSTRQDIVPIFNSYVSQLLSNDAIQFKQLLPNYTTVCDSKKVTVKPKSNHLKPWLIGKLIAVLNRIIPD